MKQKTRHDGDTLRRRAEQRLADLEEGKTSVSVADQTVLVHELQVHQIELEMQNEELRRAQQEADEARSRYQGLYDFAPVGYLSLDAAGAITEANLTTAALLGCERNRVVGRPLSMFFAPESRGEYDSFLRRLASGGAGAQCEVLLGANAKRQGWLLLDGGAFVGGETRQPVRLALMDITERKWAEEALKIGEERLRFASSAADIGMWHWDLVNDELDWDEKCKGLFGYPPEHAMTYEAFLEPIHAEERQEIDNAVHKALQDKAEYSVEMRVVLPDGRLRWVMSKGRGFYDEQGNPVRMHGIAMDITARKQAEAEIQRLASFPLMNPNPVLELDANGHMVFCNPAAKRVLENGEYNISINPLIPQDMPVILQDLREKKAGQFRREIRINGRFFEELIYIAPPFQSVRIYTMDITERKLAEEEIERLNTDLAARAAELEAANRELDAFNYTVAHDLRKPLATVNGYCQVIRELCGDDLDEQCRKYLQEAYDGTWRMNRLIDTLLNFSRLTHVEPRRETVDLGRLAREIADGLQLAEPERRATFRIAEGITANGDPILLRVVLENLLGNAWKYTDAQEEAVIEFGATESDGNPVCFVRDNGPGFAAADAETLFRPFQRLSGTEEYKGFGIGLATVQRIIQRHGGRVWAEGEPGKGATFYFTL